MVYPKIVNELEDDSDAELVGIGDGEAEIEFNNHNIGKVHKGRGD